MFRMQVPAPQWMQMTPQGLSFAQPAGAAVFTNALRPNPLEGVGGLSGWSALGGAADSDTGDFIALLEKVGFPKFANETMLQYLERAKDRFEEEFGEVFIPEGKSEYWAFAQHYLDYLSEQEAQARHKKRYYEDANYRKAAQEEHQRRMISDPKYADWVEGRFALLHDTTPPPPLDYVKVQSLANQRIYRAGEFTSTRPVNDPRFANFHFAPKGAAPAPPQTPKIPTLPTNIYASQGQPTALIDMLKNPLVIGGIVAAVGGLWWLNRGGKEGAE